MASRKVPVIITYQKPGTQPPLFVAGTFSHPQWEPCQMEFATDDEGEHTFKKEVAVAPGATIQYKFRVGAGDWWVLDESAPTVTDEAGNRNNVLNASSAVEATTESSKNQSDEVPFLKMTEDAKEKEDPDSASVIPTNSGDNAGTPVENDEKPPASVKVERNQPDGTQVDIPTKAPEAKTEELQPDENAATEASSKPIASQEDKRDHGSNVEEEPLEPQQGQPWLELGHSDKLKPVANAAKEALSRRDPSSGASTPSYAKTAAEVADSAALLDQEEEESELSDAEAGKIGLRRLSSTPIPEVALTAAEVADSAQALDDPEAPFECEPLSTTYDDFYEDEDVHGDHKPPLFSHECIGMDDDDGHEEVHETENGSEDGGAPESTASGVEYDVDKIDLNDPTLEQFPSSRADIYSTVRKIETGLGEDHSVFEGVPPSPIVGSARRGSNDILGDYYATSPVATSPVATRTHDRLRVSRSPHGSTSSLSLQSISEGDEPEPADEEEGSPQGLRPVPGKPKLKLFRTPDSDEDEGVAMTFGNKTPRKDPAGGDTGLLTPEAVPSPKALVPDIPPEPVPDISDPIPEAASGETPVGDGGTREEAAKTPTTPKTILAESQENNSPRIVLEPAEETAPEQPMAEEIDEAQTLPFTPETEATATSSHMIKRAVPGSQNGSRPGTPASMHSNHLQGDRQGWFGAFFRVLFDWFGTFINRLYGGR